MQDRQSSEEPVDDSEEALMDAVERIKDETPQLGLDSASRSHIRNMPPISTSSSSMGNVTCFLIQALLGPPGDTFNQPSTRAGLRTIGPRLESPASKGEKGYPSHPFGQQYRLINSSSGYGTNQSSYFPGTDSTR